MTNLKTGRAGVVVVVRSKLQLVQDIVGALHVERTGLLIKREDGKVHLASKSNFDRDPVLQVLVREHTQAAQSVQDLHLFELDQVADEYIWLPQVLHGQDVQGVPGVRMGIGQVQGESSLLPDQGEVHADGDG